MTTRDALLREIVRAPAEDTPRLAFADLVEEEGDPDWAELIRVQVALARAPECPADERTAFLCCRDDCLKCPLVRRERQVHPLAAWKSVLLPGFPREAWDGDFDWFAIRRGFVARWVTTTGWFARYAADVFRVHPLEEVVLIDLEPDPIFGPGSYELLGYAWGIGLWDPSPVVREIFPRLRGGPHHTRVDALADLSQAALLLGRKLAGIDL